jgi:hypothetical protein
MLEILSEDSAFVASANVNETDGMGIVKANNRNRPNAMTVVKILLITFVFTLLQLEYTFV